MTSSGPLPKVVAREHEPLPARQPARGENTPESPAAGPAPVAGRLTATVTSELAALGAQAKLVVGHAHDPAEAEADELARRVVQRLSSTAGASEVATGGSILHGFGPLARRMADPSGVEGGEVSTETEAALARASAGGRPLPGVLRRRMEDAFGSDLAGVRVHTGSESQQLNVALGARAFTLGNDIHFRDGLPDTGSTAGQTLLAHELAHTLQQSGPVQRSVQREPAGAEGGGTAPTGAGEWQIDGEVPDTDVVQGASTKMPKFDSAGSVRQDPRPDAPAHAESASGAVTFRVLSSSLGMGLSGRRDDAVVGKGSGATDTVTASIATSYKNGNKPNADAFGEEEANWSADKTRFTAKIPKKGTPSIKISTRLNLQTLWGVDGGGATDVKSGTDPTVTADNFKEIAADLTPAAQGGSWVAPRNTYWSKALTERHEKVHASDDKTWGASTGKQFAKDWLEKQSITLTEADRKDEAVVQGKVDTLVEDLVSAVDAAAFANYAGVGKAYHDRPGEVHAFGDGKKPYQALADAVTKQGKKLEAVQKKRADKAAATAAKATPTGAKATTGGSAPTGLTAAATT